MPLLDMPLFQTPDPTPPAVHSQEDRYRARTARIKALRAELQTLLDEEAQEASRGQLDLDALKEKCIRIALEETRVKAILTYRNCTGVGLKEAMDTIDGLLR